MYAFPLAIANLIFRNVPWFVRSLTFSPELAQYLLYF